MKFQNCVFFVLLFEIRLTYSDINNDVFTGLARQIGQKLWELGSNLTRHSELKNAFIKLNLTELNGREIIQEMSDRASTMIELKKSALYRIVNVVEEYSKNLSDIIEDKSDDQYKFNDAKNLSNEIKNMLSKDVNFFNTPVTTKLSTVHIPTDVFSGRNETLLGIKCTKELDRVFRHNYDSDPTLSWQYFAGISGFMRIYPGMEWDNFEPDLFDARSRPWYIEAATDPKDVVILVDNSGSMMGQKRKIARHTVNTILETLGPNDFVNIFEFAQNVSPVVSCFSKGLVQANLVTIRQLKNGVEKMNKSASLANFSRALTEAFEVLESHRRELLGSMCNQAIMLITDGVPDSYTAIFKKFNWGNSTEPPFPVRVFTYLIGRDGTDFRETRWMACANQGYYVQLNTMQEVKEQVYNYMNVLARPLVLQNIKKIGWTSLYVHKVDPKIIDYKWEMKQNEHQLNYTKSYKENWKTFLSTTEQVKRILARKKVELDQNKNIGDLEDFHFMISISHPAYDQRTKRTNVANLLGVAATDIPIEEFRKIMKPHYLGVNNFGFIVNNNGYIIMHPDLRPFFIKTLKPGYNSVDMLEIELLDHGNRDKLPRDFDIQVQMINNEPMYTLSNLSLLRDLVINQSDNSNYSFIVKYHFDNMKRVASGKRHYFIKKINSSPLTMVLTIMQPACKENPCLATRLAAPNAEENIKMTSEKIKELFSGNWNIHPEWFYCKFNYYNEYYKSYADGAINNKTSELMYFLKKMERDEFWKESRDPYANASEFLFVHEQVLILSKFFMIHTLQNKNYTFTGDKELIRNVIYDANVTKNIFQHLENDLQISPELNFNDDSLLNVFIATHSGLIRWKDFKNTTNFGIEHNKAIDEVWYKRAVHQYYVNDSSFVFSVPLYEEFTPDTAITASHAIFLKEKKKNLEAPAAVVGFQFRYTDFEQYVKNVINSVHNNFSAPIHFYILDNDGYILSTNNTFFIGKFFGEVHPSVMSMFTTCGIFKPIIVYDYQGVCFEDPNKSSSATRIVFINPLKQFTKIITWTIETFLWSVININFKIIISGFIIILKGEIMPQEESETESVQNFDSYIENSNIGPKYVQVKHIVMINRTKPQTCDRKVKLFHLESKNKWDRRSNCSQILQMVRVIPHTNLLLVILSNASENNNRSQSISTDPVKIVSNLYTSPVCYKVNAVLSRRRPSTCAKNHKEVS
ncbi:hypothetical protein PGB90_000252 [Kerria lacca]